MSPAVTVLTAVRNAARLLPSTISSIQSQTFQDWEYVIVDDASSDDTTKIIESHASTDARIKLVRRAESGGPYVAANEGLAHARGRYIVRLDGDDVALPMRIERQVAYLAETGLRACASFVRLINDAGRPLGRFRQLNADVSAIKYMLCVGGSLVHSTACIERDALTDIGGYAELPVSQDLRMWCELARRDWLGVVPQVLVNFRRGPSTLTRTSPDLQERLAVDILKSHLGALDVSPWSSVEVQALRPMWYGIDAYSRTAALKRWTTLWRMDRTLGSADRRALRSAARAFRSQVARAALVRQGISLETLKGILSNRGAAVRAEAP